MVPVYSLINQLAENIIIIINMIPIQQSLTNSSPLFSLSNFFSTLSISFSSSVVIVSLPVMYFILVSFLINY
ncbi:hypothetical protein [Methanobrevibacter wolinii]|uniref:hypothetical protein n=1 Tax=Methanobrevibacter wolinii TaxID=190977 RepID=UPI0012EB8040|nr:hypothetical protein [Methanobrevibacter wolinii]MDD5959059.1 hypothetical protein [Methanobrevibacter wolinii]